MRGGCDWIGFNYAKSCKDPSGKGVHFFLDDYQFNRIWRNIDRYIPMLKKFKYVLSPDFSVYSDFPKAMQIYNHYRKHWVGAYLQEAGVNVIPTITWNEPESFEWCFDGEPEEATVAISSVGVMKNKETKALLMKGYEEMMRRLRPQTILFYGSVPSECEGNIVKVKAFQDKWKVVKQNGER